VVRRCPRRTASPVAGARRVGGQVGDVNCDQVHRDTSCDRTVFARYNDLAAAGVIARACRAEVAVGIATTIQG
jgi:hypothetical protein